MLYSELTRQYFESAAGAGVLTGRGIGRGAAGSRARGTWVQFDVGIDPAAPPPRPITAARFLAFACPHTIAVAAWIAERAVGLAPPYGPPDDVRALQARFAVPVEKLGRLLIVEDAWTAAIAALPG